MDWIAVKRRVRAGLPGSVREWARLGLHPTERRAAAGFVQNGPRRLSRAERVVIRKLPGAVPIAPARAEA